MNINFRLVIPAAIAAASGLLVLLGYFISPEQAGALSLLLVIRQYFLQIAVILVGAAVVVGVFNLSAVHWRKIQRQEKNTFYSILLLGALVVTFAAGLYDYVRGTLGDGQRSWLMILFNSIQIPVERSLMALLAVALVYAAARMLHWRKSGYSVLFVGVVLVVLLGTAMYLPVISDSLKPFITNVVAIGGVRGLLIGVALGTIATGLRVLLAADRPYGG